MESNRQYTLSKEDLKWIQDNGHLLPSMSAGKHRKTCYMPIDKLDVVSSRHVDYAITMASTYDVYGGPEHPHLQWVRMGVKPKSKR